MRSLPISWPGGHAFAFSIFDDTDNATLDNIRPVYRLLRDLGLRTTKSVWPLPSLPDDKYAGASLQDSAYRDLMLELQADGFEIGYHGACSGESPRERVIEALDLFRATFGHDPRTASQHAPSRSNLYWGTGRVRSRALKTVVGRLSMQPSFSGDDPASPLFWGDLCRDRIQFVRNYGFYTSDVLQADPWTPYHDPQKPYVNQWFSVCGDFGPDDCDRVISPENIRRWEKRGGMVLLMTHFGWRFSDGARVRPNVERSLRALAGANAWFAPVGTILDYVRKQRGDHQLTASEGASLETAWLGGMVKNKIRSRVIGALGSLGR